ncbi:hypothetical protein [Sphingomonas baiyangensis]|uniref:Uncharacterized protein n=1 Tax=Sphingomonas baiyangensis TaxID=2572576 RepID=A0A4U1L2T9_9SPHN|nr:hypothetical protein [Sphingomonas baiyangensis]TKD50503.1 hypothetical protein FBR43_06795 [Sphingomonas baiyangensis]
MLAGLIFATEAAEERGETLAATLPFGGMTLIEYQARLLIAAGASHILVAVARVTPALLGAVNRITRRGVAVDIVRSAEEAAARAHPLASIVVIADSLVTIDPAIRAIAAAQPDTLMVTPEAESPAAVERVDAGHNWAGLASLNVARLKEIAAMPREYDFQSALLRATVQGGAAQLLLPASAKRAGHGVERHPSVLASRSNAVLAALAVSRTDWPDRFVFTPISRVALPAMVARGVPGVAVVALALAVAAGGLVALAASWVASGLIALVVAAALLSTGSLLSWLRGDDRHARAQEHGVAALAGLGVVMTGIAESRAAGTLTALTLALALLSAAALCERMPVRAQWWWASPSAHLLLLAPFAIIGHGAIGLALCLAYAFATLALAVEAVRAKP